MNKFSPVAVFVYNRPEHAEKALSALGKCKNASETDMYIFCDNFKKDKDRSKVEKVREVADRFAADSAFKKVTVIKAEKNRGLAKSVIGGVTEIINTYGSIIVVEDDLIVTPDFLDYMDSALEYYKENPKIWSISGYSFPIKALDEYNHDIYMIRRGCSWGWGTWSDRWATVDWNVSDYNKFKFDFINRRRFAEAGADLPLMLDLQMNGMLDSWAIRWCYSQYKQNKLTVYPKFSRIFNIGTDGTGTHYTEADNRYDTVLYCESKECSFENIEPCKNIYKEFAKKYLSGTCKLKSNVWNIMLRLGLKKSIGGKGRYI